MHARSRLQLRGSSPHTRGAPKGTVTETRESRIIPAYAGSTPSPSISATPTPDHPRIRGEHSIPGAANRPFSGSSPHTRGARPGRRRRGQGARIIPAYAGSTVCSVLSPPAARDHPRIRGEHDVAAPHRRARLGSSPHTRGARLIASWWAFRSGIIPAYAGSTSSPRMRGAGVGDHPRIRGEHRLVAARGGSGLGSSPHTRGARPSPGRHPHRIRIIPAYAGSTSSSRSTSACAPDHPRIRGEHCFHCPLTE